MWLVITQWQDNEAKFKESGSKIMEVLDRTARLSVPRGSDLPADETFARWDPCLCDE